MVNRLKKLPPFSIFEVSLKHWNASTTHATDPFPGKQGKGLGLDFACNSCSR